MSTSKNFRPINNYEKELVINSLSKISSNIDAIFKEDLYKFYLILDPLKKNKKKLKIYLIKNKEEEIHRLKKMHSKIHSIGLYFGFINKGIFYLSLEGAEFLHKREFLTKIKFIYVTKKGEKSVLYGNNILKNMITKTSINLQSGDFILIFNAINEILAIAISKVDDKNIEKLKPTDIIALNLSDKGYYLRVKQ